MNSQNRLLELDALRGLAALSVLLFHFTLPNEAELGWRFGIGVTGVDIFFMISGFVIFLTIQKMKNWQQFVIFRFSRLYPVYWVCVSITASFIFFCDPKVFDPINVLANLTMFPSYFGIEDLDGSYWTLIIELLFYTWVLLVYITNQLKKIVLIGVVFTITIILFHHFGSNYPAVYLFALQKIQLINHFPLFLSGIVFYKLFTRPFSFSYVLVLLFCIASAIYLSDKGGRTMQILQRAEHGTLIVIYHLIFVLFISGRLTFLKMAPLLFLGRISYSLYLLHQYIGLQLIRILKTHFSLDIQFAILLTIVISIGLAALVTKYIEIPSVQFVRLQYKRQQAST